MRLARTIFTAGILVSPLATLPAMAQAVFQKVLAQPAEPKTKVEPTISSAEQDKKSLETAGLKADDAVGLIKFLGTRTLNDTDMGKIQALIKKMHVDAPFDDRVTAQQELLALGGQAIAPLKLVIKENTDPEIAYRAKECLKKLEKDKSYGSDVTAAVVRAVGQQKTPEAAAALMSFLPLADSTPLIETIQASMTANSGTDKPSALLLEALTDKVAIRRQVAAIALLSGGIAEKRIRFPDSYPKLVALAKTDADPTVRFEVAKALFIEAREKESIGIFIDMMPDAKRGQTWQIEELLIQIAGKDAPKERCKHIRDAQNPDKEMAMNKPAREKAKVAWKAWYDKVSDKLDFSKNDVKLTTRGELVVINQTYNGNAWQVVITEYGTDGKERKAPLTFLTNNNNAFDVVIKPDGKIFVFTNNATLEERDATGKLIRSIPIPQDANVRNFGFQPKAMQALESGGVLVVHAGGFVEFDKDGKTVVNHARPLVNKNPTMDLAGVVKLKSGEYLLSLTSQKMIYIDAKGKEIPEKDKAAIPTGPPGYKNPIVLFGEDKVLMMENSQMVEYDLKTGKADGFKMPNIYNAQAAQRLPNGNVMYIDTNTYPARVVEKSPTNEEVWTSRSSTDQNSTLLRAYVK